MLNEIKNVLFQLLSGNICLSLSHHAASYSPEPSHACDASRSAISPMILVVVSGDAHGFPRTIYSGSLPVRRGYLPAADDRSHPLSLDGATRSAWRAATVRCHWLFGRSYPCVTEFGICDSSVPIQSAASHRPIRRSPSA